MEALIPAITLDAKALHGAPFMIQEHRLFLQRQARDQILGALLGRLSRVQVKGIPRRLGRRDCISQRREQCHRDH
jgi:hypothetical protein